MEGGTLFSVRSCLQEANMAIATKICFIRDTILENYLDISNITTSYKQLQKQTRTMFCSDKNAQLSRQEHRA